MSLEQFATRVIEVIAHVKDDLLLRITALEARVAELDGKAAGTADKPRLEFHRVDPAELRPRVRYRGLWFDDQPYRPNDYVIDRSGHAWICKAAATGTPPGTDDALWERADGRDA